MNIVKFKFEASECNGWPKIKFFIDEDLYHDYEFDNKSALVELPMDLLFGNHTLSIEFYGKTSINTILQGDQIIKDQLVTLQTIYIDNVQVPDFVKYSGFYKVNEEIKPQALTWGENGNWQLDFEFPIIDWVLEKKLSMNYDTGEQWSVATYHPKKIKILKEMLQDLENMLDNDKL